MITTTMWAIGWKNYLGENYPKILKSGPWMLCYSKEMAEKRRLCAQQDVRRVKVTIECARGRKCKTRDC